MSKKSFGNNTNVNNILQFNTIYDTPPVNLNQCLANNNVSIPVRTAIYKAFPLAYPNYFAQVITQFASLRLLSGTNEQAISNMHHIQQYAELWFTNDDDADLKKKLTTLDRRYFDQAKFDTFVAFTKEINEQYTDPHDIRCCLILKLDELLNNSLRPR